jgi:Glycosyl transferase family 2
VSAPKRVLRSVPSAPAGHPSVTVVVPSYNYAHFLPETAFSVLSQDGVDLRVLIVDDGSTDDTPRVTAEIAASDPRVTVVRHENQGMIPTVNFAFGQVETEYVLKVDADDLLAPGALARATALLEAHPGVAFVYGRPEHFRGPTPELAESATRSWTLWSGREWLARRCRTGVNLISQPEVVIRTSMLHRAMPIRADLPHTSDLHLWLQLAAMGDVGRVNGPIQGYYREHDGSMQRTVNSGRLFDLQARRKAFDLVFAAEAAELPGAQELHDRVRRTLAGGALDRACRAYDRGRVGEEPVDEFVAFAFETWPAADELPEHAALERRRAVGAERAQRHPRFFADAVVRRAMEETSRWRWRRTGEVAALRPAHLSQR